MSPSLLSSERVHLQLSLMLIILLTFSYLESAFFLLTLLWFLLCLPQAADCRSGLINVQRSGLPRGLKIVSALISRQTINLDNVNTSQYLGEEEFFVFLYPRSCFIPNLSLSA